MKTESIVARYQQLMNGRRDAIHPELARSVPVNWDDAPLRQTVRPGLASVPLAADFDPDLWLRSPAVLDAARLAQVLLAAHGILRRKLDPNWDRSAAETATKSPLYARGTSSGGGLYPTELYVVASDMAGLPDGVYHYSEAHSALVRIRMGHFKSTVVEGLFSAPPRVESFLVLTLRFWKNAFKYHSFGYQLMLQDVGACAATIVTACSELGLKARTFHEFDDTKVGALLGVNEDEEAPALVVGLSSAKNKTEPFNSIDIGPRTNVTELKAPSLERSTTVSIPQLILDLHQATKQSAPASEALSHSRIDSRVASVDTHSPALESSLPSILRTRESCWGRFRTYPAMQLDPMIKALQFASAGGVLEPRHSETNVVRACILALRVDNLSPAAYEYSGTSGKLTKISDWAGTSESLQTLYWMPNYNLSQVAAVVAIAGATKAAFATWGDRSIRTINIAAGALAQRLYIGCSALSLGCGVVFGFNAAMAATLFHLPAEGEHPLLLAFIGPRSQSAAAYDFRVSGAISTDSVKNGFGQSSRS